MFLSELNAEVAELLGFGTNDLVTLGDFVDKRSYRFVNNFVNDPVPISRIYILQEADKPGIESLSPKEAVIELIRHSLPTRFAQTGDASHFQHCISLAKKVNIFRLKRTTTIHELPFLAKIVEEHISGYQ